MKMPLISFRIVSRLREMFEHLRQPLVDLALAGGKLRPCATPRPIVAMLLDLGQRLQHDFANAVHFRDHGLDAEVRRLQRHQVGLRLRQFLLEPVAAS